LAFPSKLQSTMKLSSFNSTLWKIRPPPGSISDFGVSTKGVGAQTTCSHFKGKVAYVWHCPAFTFPFLPQEPDALPGLTYQNIFLSNSKKIMAPIIKITNITLAIPAAASEIPPKPKMAATMAIIIQMTNHFNIIYDFRLDP